MDVRPYRPDDERGVVALWRACFPETRSWHEPRGVIRRMAATAPELFLVGTVDERVVATVLAGWDGHRGWIYHLAVLAELRRRGLGRAMMHAAEERLRAQGCPKVNLQVLAENRDVVAFYERLGYGVEERVSMGKALD